MRPDNFEDTKICRIRTKQGNLTSEGIRESSLDNNRSPIRYGTGASRKLCMAAGKMGT